MVDINNKTKAMKVTISFAENVIDKIIEDEGKRGLNISIPDAFRILEKRIEKAGGLRTSSYD